MNVLEFKELDKIQQSTIVYCIIDRIDYYANDGIKNTMRNIGDWTIQNITIQGYTVLVSKDEDSLLRRAAEMGFIHAVVFSTGTEFINGNTCFERIKELTDQHFFLAGHILDRSNMDAYYELHHQLYIINLKIYQELGYPTVGQQIFDVKHTQLVPTRSELNYHDDHTPIWVGSNTNESREYKHQAHGWNIISIALLKNKPICVFDEKIRNNKNHYYPEYPSTYENKINFVYKRESFCSGLSVYPFNSEEIIKLNIGSVEQLIVPASGLNWLLYLDRYCTDNAVIKFYDYSLTTLNFIRLLIEKWDGEDYIHFVEMYIHETFGYIENKHEIPIFGPTDLKTEWNKFKSIINWNKIKNHKVEFYFINLLDSSKDLKWIDPDKITLMNASNIFNYIGTMATHSLQTRINSEISFTNKLRDRNPNAHLLLGRSANAAFENKLSTWHY